MRLLIITNIPTPYRIAFFNVLNQELLKVNGKLKVLYCSYNEPNRFWDIDFKDQEFDYSILKGFHYNFENFFLHFNPSVVRETKNFNPTCILYAGSWNMPTVIYSLLWNSFFKSNVKKVFWSEGHDGSVLHASGLIPKIRKRILNYFDGFAVPNGRSESYLFENLKVDRKPIVLLPNTVDGEFFTKPASWSFEKTNQVKEEFNIPTASKIIIQVAQIDDRKGIKELVLYWEKLSENLKGNYHLVLVGEGSLREQLKQQCTEKNINTIHFLGNQPKEKVRDLLFSSNIFLLLTKNDPNPLTLIEASFAKLPIMTTKFAGNCHEIILKNDNGVILSEISFNAFKEGFEKIKILALNTEAGEISFLNVKKNFDIKNVSQNLIEQIKSYL